MFGNKRRHTTIFAVIGTLGVSCIPLATVGATPVTKPTAQVTTSISSGAWRPRVETKIGENGSGELYVNDRLVLRLRTSQAGFSPMRRAEIAAARLQTALSAGLSAGDIIADTETDRANPRLKGAGVVLASADKAEAKASTSSPSAVVRGWASALRAALAIPGLAASDRDILIPLGETRPLRLSGAARGPLSISSNYGSGSSTASSNSSDDGEGSGTSASGSAAKTVVQVMTDTGNENLITLRGLSPGRDVLTFEREGAISTVTVRVQPYAGRLDSPKPVTITGKGVEIGRVARYAAGAALASAVPIPGAIARVDTDALSVALPIAAGAESTVNVPVTVSGPEMIPVKGTVVVPLRNEALPAVSTDSLLYSNNPERVLNFGTLFAARLPVSQNGAATRLLFHHQSAMRETAWFAVELLNDSDQTAQVQVIGGGAGPVRDTVWVGFRAASDFLKDYLADAGLVVDIPPHSRLALLSTRLAPNNTVSGLMQLRQLSGPAPLVRVAAQPANDGRALAETWQPTPLLPGELNRSGDGGLAYDLSEHVYPQPIKRIETTYTVDGNWAFIGLGKDPLEATRDPGKKLYGNYGVWYEITATIQNPSDREAKARVVFVPSAGLAGGVFLVDGKPVEIPQTNVPQEPVLGVYRLAPRETRTVKIVTIPLSGSNYPARIVIRP